MNIKKLTLVVIIITLSLSLYSCSSFRAELFTRNDEKIADASFQKITKALENKDKKGLKKMFSPNALKKANDIDGGIDYLMNFYKGKIKSSKYITLTSPSLNDHGEKTSEINCSYTVTTDKDIYMIYFTDKVVDTKNPDNVGLYWLVIAKKSDYEKGSLKNVDKCVGIYCPDTAK